MIGLQPRPWFGKLTRFFVVGVAAALLLFLTSWLLQHLGIRPFAAGALAYGIAFAFAYTLQRNWTFGGDHSHGHALPRYLAVQAGSAVATGLFTEFAVVLLGWAPPAASAIATAGASIVSFVLSCMWIFPDRATAASRDSVKN